MCPTCRCEVSSAYCPGCGEKTLHPQDLKLRKLFGELVTALTSVDGKVIRSFRALLLQPGSLTVAFLIGRRKPFISALPLFFLANVLFFASQTISPVKVFSPPLASHLEVQDWKVLANTLVSRRIEARNWTVEQYASVFDPAVALNAKSLVILMAIPLLLLLPLLFLRKRRPYVLHAVFALHTYAFNLVLLSVLLAVIAVGSWLGNEAMFRTAIGDDVLFGVYLLGNAVYLYLATRTAYDASGITHVMQTLSLTLVAGLSIVSYRFLLFLITLYST
jgi:Protein of unknown function (DUF3667)